MSPGVREQLRSLGIDLTSQFQDDNSALQHLAQAYRQAQQGNQLAQYGQIYLQHQGQFQQWAQEQAAKRQADEAAKQQSWWKAPEFDPAWRQKITRDPVTGQLRAVDGADPTIVQKYMQAVEHQQSFLDKFAFDPIGAIKPGIEDVVKQVAQQVMQQQLGGFQEQTFARGWVEANTSWLHQRDTNNNLLRDPAGRPQLSPYGARFAGYVQQAEQVGIRNVQQQRDYAIGLLQRDYLAQQFGQSQQQQQQANQGEQAKQQFLQQAQQGAHVPNVGGSTQNGAPTNGSANGTGIRNQRDLQNAMMAALATNGFQAGQSLVG